MVSKGTIKHKVAERAEIKHKVSKREAQKRSQLSNDFFAHIPFNCSRIPFSPIVIRWVRLGSAQANRAER